MKAVICPVCWGKGVIKDVTDEGMEDKTCHGCNGKGWVEVGENYPYIPPCPYPHPSEQVPHWQSLPYIPYWTTTTYTHR